MSKLDRESSDTWLTQGEKGTLLGLRAAYWFATAFGRAPTRLLVRLIAVWYTLFSPKIVAASKAWLSTVYERPARRREVYQHLVRFAQVTADRFFLLQGKTSSFWFTLTGNEHLQRVTRESRGAILLGAHVGSFEAMRASSRDEGFPLTIMGHFENAPMINELLTKLDPETATRVVHIQPNSVDFIFEAQRCIETGRQLGTMGDRVGLNEKSVVVTFFGRPARFPTGPFVLASVLKCPVFLTFGLYREPNRYDLFCELFAERVVLPRRDREQAVRVLVQQYAARLEAYCRLAPDNWFNFYDFWASASRPPEAVSGSLVHVPDA